MAVRLWIESNVKEIVDYINKVPEEITMEVMKGSNKIMTKTAKVTRDSLTLGNGVRKGIYRKSLKGKNLSDSPMVLHFIVKGTGKHYRLSHLLEKGHRIVIPIKQKGGGYKPTYIGRHTKSIPHISIGQDYADKEVLDLYNKAIDKALKGK